MKTGKVSDTILGRSVFKLIGRRGNSGIEKPAYGQDAARIDNRDKSSLVATERDRKSVV